MIKLLTPDMPTTDDLLPYLRRIDAARVYVNNGPLVQELQAHLEQMTGAYVALVSNGTVALELALKATLPASKGWPFEPYTVKVPAMTFSATGLAVRNAGHRITLVDVDSQTWQMSSQIDDVECLDMDMVMPVATFGNPVDVNQWEGYSIPVVIDAAGAFPQQEVSRDPNIATCFSLHATKFIGCGEGGFVASANEDLIERVRSLSMFGEGGTNAKMSEYHAAVALASLDRLPEKEKRAEQVTTWYAKHGEWLELRTEGTIMNVLLPAPAAEVIPKMLAAGIETKQWYHPYLDERIEFMDGRDTTCGKFPVTDHLRGHLLGLPFHNFLTEADIMHVCSTLKGALR